MIKLIFYISILISAVHSQHEYNKVVIQNSKLNVNGTEYFIKGICYHPVPIGETKRNFEMIDTDLSLMKEAGINTIRVYSPIDDVKILDKIDKAGIKVIINFGYNQNGFYDILNNTYIDYVKKYKDHNAILFWELGNEYNFNPQWFNGNLENWYNSMNSAAENIKKIDMNHPVSTAHGEIPSLKALSMGSKIDLWGMNVYRWDNPTSIINEWKKISDKPIYFSEIGSDSYMTVAKDGFIKGENQFAQAEANKKIITRILNASNDVSGLLIFQFVDGLWKAGNPNQQDIGGWAPNSTGVPYDGTANEEFWGIVDINRNKKKTFEIIKKLYNEFKI
ncbi:MAG: hypothetical protein CND00_04770 [Cryomorphaceae bacterium MED-G14]|nr:MAG: hypothetical protein CND00_04770 [Cryomorphaceae bacterium MED-G14]